MEAECEGDVHSVHERSQLRSKTLMVSESQVRYLDCVFCVSDKRNKISTCFRGAGMSGVGDRLARGCCAHCVFQCGKEPQGKIVS